MSVYIARQPIFDRNNAIFGYELLFRQSSVNHFIEMDDDLATSELIYNSFLVFGIDNLTDGTMAFINFSKALVNSDFIELLPKNRIVVEILEREKANQSTLEACTKFRNMGYTLAMDDFVLDEENTPLLDLIDIVKVEFPSVSMEVQADLIKRYNRRIKFIAEKIETREDYAAAFKMGYDLFQGYFFSKPAVLNSKDIGLVNTNLIRIVEELNQPEPSYRKMSDIIQMDLGLSYKLLRLVNSAYVSPRYEIQSIHQALNMLGTREVYQWMSLMLLKDIQNSENSEMVKQSLIRGKLMSFLCNETEHSSTGFEYFFTGIFSQMDIILNKSFTDVLKGLPLSNKVKNALLGEKNELRNMLEFVVTAEKGEWKNLNQQPIAGQIAPDRFMNLYVDALKWVKSIGSF